MNQYHLRYAARTDQGLVRSDNEDAFGTLPDAGMVVVADGMGGYRGGGVASRLAVDVVLRHLLESSNGRSDPQRCLDAMEQAVERADLAIRRAAAHAPELQGMGTTIVAGVFGEGELVFAWVGDSRLYLLRDGRLGQLTEDHTLVREMVQQGLFDSVAEAMEAGVGDNLLTRAVGADMPLPVATGSVEIAADDLYLFCTDGLTHMVADTDMERVLAERDLDPDAKADRMIQLACEAGGMDNISVVLVQVAAAQASAPVIR